MKDVLKRLIDDYHERTLPEIVRRNHPEEEFQGKALALIGMRRVGKTYLCYQWIKELLASGIPIENTVYLNFEDDRLFGFKISDFQTIMDVYYGQYPEKKEEKCYYFFDEIQNVVGWERFIRRLIDTENVSIYITGSSATLLSKEMATSLRGRSLNREIFPYDFDEFIRARNIGIKNTKRIGEKTRMLLLNAAEQYLHEGGLPEAIGLDSHKQQEILQGYVDAVILRDVIERHHVSNTVALRNLVHHILSSPTTRLSVNKFYNSLKSQGIKIGKNDIYEFIQYLSDAYLIFPVPIWSRSEKAKQVNPKKIYLIDNGILSAFSTQMTKDLGALLENLVYLKLHREGFQVHYYVTQSGNEVDFSFTHQGSTFLIQVCWSLDTIETREREIRAIKEALTEQKAAKAMFVTWNDESTADSVPVVTLWQFLIRGLEL